MDTCDECGPSVQARKTIHLPSGRHLTYCDHHATLHGPRLRALGALTYEIGKEPCAR